MKRLIEKIVFWGFVIACRFATWPTRRSPSLVKATTEGVVREPSALGITTGSPPSMTATTEFVVPRSIPMTLLMTPALSYGKPRASVRPRDDRRAPAGALRANMRLVQGVKARAMPPETLPLWQGTGDYRLRRPAP